MLYGTDNGSFGNIKTDLKNKMTCGLDSYPKIKENTVELLNTYHMSKQLPWATPVKEEVAFTYTSSNTKTIKTNKKG